MSALLVDGDIGGRAMNKYIQKPGSKNIYTPARQPIKIIIPGRPVPKQRPRFGRGGRVYTPIKTKEYEELVGWCAKQYIPQPLEGNVALHIKAYVANNIFPDLDNIAKAIMDGLNGVAYKDDKQVSCLTIQRLKGPEEKVEIELEEVS